MSDRDWQGALVVLGLFAVMLAIGIGGTMLFEWVTG